MAVHLNKIHATPVRMDGTYGADADDDSDMICSACNCCSMNVRRNLQVIVVLSADPPGVERVVAK